jgi:hypothetical protein
MTNTPKLHLPARRQPCRLPKTSSNGHVFSGNSLNESVKQLAERILGQLNKNSCQPMHCSNLGGQKSLMKSTPQSANVLMPLRTRSLKSERSCELWCLAVRPTGLQFALEMRTCGARNPLPHFWTASAQEIPKFAPF